MSTNLGVALAPAIQAAHDVSNTDYYRQQAAAAATSVAQKYGLDPNEFVPTFLRLLEQESGFDPGAYNQTSGASGIGQIIPREHPNVDPWNPDDAIPYAADYLASQIQANAGDYLKGVAAYNYGPGNVGAISYLPDDQFYAALPSETQDYVNNVVSIKPPDTGVDMSQNQDNPPPQATPTPGSGDALDQLINQHMGGAKTKFQKVTSPQFPPGTYYDPSTGAYYGPDGVPIDTNSLPNSPASRNASTSEGRLALDTHQQAIQQAIDYVKVLQAEREAMVSRANEEDKAALSALPYQIGSQRYYMGLGPNDVAVRMGLTTASPIAGTPFDPSNIGSAGAGLDPLVAYHLAQLDRMPAPSVSGRLGVPSGAIPQRGAYPVPPGAEAPAEFAHA